MKKYKIVYGDYLDLRIRKTVNVTALSEQDAISWFFDNIGGRFLECVFVDYV